MHSSRMHTTHSFTICCGILCMPPATMHAPYNHAHPPQPCMPPINHACPPPTMHTPPPTMHAPWQPCMPPMNRMINRCKNITLSQTSFAGGNKETFQWQANCLLYQRNKFEHVSSKTSPVYTQTE